MTYFAFKEIRLNRLSEESNKLLIRYQNKIANTFVENKSFYRFIEQLNRAISIYNYIPILIVLNENNSYLIKLILRSKFFYFASIKLMPHIKQLNTNFTSIRTHISSYDNYQKMQKSLIDGSKYKTKKRDKKFEN